MGSVGPSVSPNRLSLAGYGKTMPALLKSNGPHVWNNRIRPRRIAKRDRLDELIGFIWFVLFIWLVQFNQTNQIDQINKRNKPVLALRAAQSMLPANFFSILLARIIHEGSSRKRADAKRDGHSET